MFKARFRNPKKTLCKGLTSRLSVFFFPLSLFLVSTALSDEKHPFGFSGLEIFKVGSRTHSLFSVDLNQDKLRDCGFVDNAKGSLCFLLQQKEEERKKPVSLEVNEIPSDARFRRVDNLTEKRIYACAVSDFNGDGIPDVAFHGDPEGLEIHWGGKEWDDNPKMFSVDNPTGKPWSLLSGDINSDGRDDLLLLTEEGFQVYRQEKGTLEEDRRIPLAGKDLSYARLNDFNGDGKNDLFYIVPGKRRVRIRFGGKKSFGPERDFRIASLRFLRCADMYDRPGVEMVAVQQNPLRVSVYGLSKQKSTNPFGEIYGYSLPGRSRGGVEAMALGDVNSDGNTDLCFALSGTGKIGVRFGDGKGDFGRLNTWPALAGTESLHFLTCEGKQQLLQVSGEEKSLGLMSWDGKRLTFPRIMSLPGRPTAWCVLRSPNGKERFVLAMSKGAGDHFLSVGDITKNTFQKRFQTDCTKRTKGLLSADFNGDGKEELLVFPAYEPPYFMLWNGEEKFKKLDPLASRTKTLLDEVKAGSVCTGKLADSKATQLLYTREDFVRLLRLGQDGKLEVLDQYHARGGASLEAVSVVDLEGDGRKEIVAFDSTNKNLVLFRRREDGLMEPADRRKVFGYTGNRIQTADIDGDKHPEFFLTRSRDIALLKRAKQEAVLKCMVSYEVEKTIKAGRERRSPFASGNGPSENVGALALGDLNSDGSNDIAFITTKEVRMHVLTYLKQKLEKRLEFPLVESKTESASSNFPVRELLVAEVTGDDMKDLLMLIHDRLILYPQDSWPDQGGKECANKSQ